MCSTAYPADHQREEIEMHRKSLVTLLGGKIALGICLPARISATLAMRREKWKTMNYCSILHFAINLLSTSSWCCFALHASGLSFIGNVPVGVVLRIFQATGQGQPDLQQMRPSSTANAFATEAFLTIAAPTG
uniref:Uncharacterized protein n=1 Tax=Anopheles culicifacies TaxID=139723 RepID=A0A182M5V3_9DIPT